MRIGLDLSIVQVNRAGSGLYAEGLYDALRAMNLPDDLIAFSAPRSSGTSFQSSTRRKLDNFYHDLAWKHAVLPLRAKRSRIDLLHEPNFIGPYLNSCPLVVTILDVAVLKMPGYFSRWFRNYARLFLPHSARTASRILTISEYSKQEMVSTLNIDPAKITVTYPGISNRFRPLTDDETAPVLVKYKLPEPYILSVCTLEPRKNILRLVEAYALLRAKGYPHKLVHVGAKGWQYAETLAAVQRLGLENDVLFLDRVPLDDLISLYNRAAVFAYPSLYEGFGLPVLEAMQCGCPVITANDSSLPEVIGDAGILIDPLSVQQIADALQTVLSDAAQQAEMKRKGLQQAAQFSWARCAAETLTVYRAVYAETHR